MEDEAEIIGDEPMALYRLYSAGGVLLYVGITHSLSARFAEHARDKPWWPEVTRKTVCWFGCRDEVVAAEAQAIKHGRPVHNVQRPRPFPDSRGSRETPLHSLRIDNDRWRAALGKARSEGRTLTDVIDAALAAYVGSPVPAEPPPLDVCEAAITTIEGASRRQRREAAAAVPEPVFREPRAAPRRRCPHPGLPRNAGGWCKECKVHLLPNGWFPD